MENNFVLVCDSVTDLNGKFTFNGVFDSVTSDSFPVQLKSMSIVANFEVTDSYRNTEHKEIYQIKFKNDVVFKTERNFFPEKQRHQFIHNINGLVFKDPGRYVVEILINGEKKGETYFIVKGK